ncbi:MAG: c-type cytochrome [Armatimonadetes bacterium]|nr:c-type cytochrome [Akkermansiaceae bacterium]
MSSNRLSALFFLVTTILPVHAAKELDASLVRATEAQSQEQELARFQFPAGFKMQLVAAEPDMHKPMNMAFDEKGRLWVTSSLEYPYAAPLDKPGRDKILIMSDFDENGRATTIRPFAEGLNVPTGVLPMPDGGCIAWSIPNIWRFYDDDKDGKSDRKEILFGPLGYEKDTHGMISSMRLRSDGWVYATHGFSNTSHFKARDGSTLDLTSGNVFRFRPDGSRVEPYSWGQVNPFGIAFDSWGSLYSADCHSAPIYQLIRGACYPSFGNPHDGMGYAPTLMQHSHSSTGISGIVILENGVWGKEWDDTIFIGNVVTSRINRDTMLWNGATPTAREEPDLVSCDDPWFRPVDLQIGPDGALYIADFYNRIIGHYEVPLTHPGRDRERGRIWRLVPPNVKVESRTVAAKIPFQPPVSDSTDPQKSLSLHFLAEKTEWNAADREHAVLALSDQHSRVKRAAAEALGLHPSSESMHSLLASLEQCPAPDTHLRHTIRIAIRNHLKLPEAFSKLPEKLSPENQADLANICLAVPSQASATFLLSYIPHHPLPAEQLSTIATQIARQLGNAAAKPLSELAQKNWPDDPETQSTIFLALLDGCGAGVSKLPEAIRRWGGKLVVKLIETIPATSLWKFESPDKPDDSPFFSVQERKCEDGRTAAFLSSLPAGGGPPGEARTGTLQSPIFELPETLSFYLCGHDGDTSQPAKGLNKVLLQDGETGEILREAAAPRDDTAQIILWGFPTERGRKVRLSIVDADSGAAYAWLAIGRVEPPVIRPENFNKSSRDNRLLNAAAIARALKTTGLAGKFQAILKNDPPAAMASSAIYQALASFSGDLYLDALAQVPEPPPAPFAAKADIPALTQVWFAAASSRSQLIFAEALVRKPEGIPMLLQLIENQPKTARLLLVPSLATTLKERGENIQQRVTKLTTGLTPASGEADKKIASFMESWPTLPHDVERGATVFQTQCAMCHQIGQVGNLIGPQLDGAGNRGLERLLEDVLDPNRVVDPAFQVRLYTRNDGTVLAGMLRSEDPDNLTVMDLSAKQTKLSKTDVKEQKTIPASLMPPTFGETLNSDDLASLMAYLLSSRK